ncbi:glycosyltransferase family 39 protein [bacterium]|nr:glycosyltransferase family 39 protein [bacterium]
MTKLKKFRAEHPEICSVLFLAVLCGLFIFWGLDFYPLLDVDETRYAIMSRDLSQSKDWNVLLLNSLPFMEKPPLYFWLVAVSIKIFGSFSEFAVRFPIALISTIFVFATYYFGKTVLSRKFGLVSAIILLTSVFFLIFSHIAILDMILTTCISISLYCAFLSFRQKDIYKKYCWWFFWTFAGLGFLAKGILALAIPFTVMFLYCLFTKNLKELFKPINFIVGFVIFLLIIMPWHIIMYRDYGWSFVNEYFIKHHFARLLTSEYIGRKHGILYFIPVFIVAFMPWTFIFLSTIPNVCKKLYERYKETEGKLILKIQAMFTAKDSEQEVLLFAALFFTVVFIVMSISSTKLPTYILPALPAAALITGYFWCTSENETSTLQTIKISTYIIAGIFILAALITSLAYVFLPQPIIEMVDSFKYSVLIGCAFVGIYLMLQLKTQKTLSIFSGYVIAMFFVITFAVTNLFSLLYAGGENELVLFSNYAKTQDTRLVTFDFAVKPSTKINYKEHIYFITDDNFEQLYTLVNNKSVPTFVIVKNSEVETKGYQDKLDKYLYLVQTGKKYSLYLNKQIPEKNRLILWIK